MKKIVILSIGASTGKSIAKYFQQLFGNYTEVKYYSESDELDFEASSVLGVASGELVIRNRALAKIQEGMDYVIAERVINHQYIQELISLRAGTNVLLVNDHIDTANSAIRQLIALGIDHVKYHPYYPDIKDFPALDIAVTPGEGYLVPKGISKVIDIGTRQIDITTLIEVARRLGLMENLRETISSQYVSDIVKLLQKIDASAREAIFMKDTIQTISDCAMSGIVLTDHNNKIISANRSFINLTKMIISKDTQVDLNDLIPCVHLEMLGEKELLTNIFGTDVLVRQKKINHLDGAPGYVYILENRKEIENLEIEIRRQSRRTEHIARYTYSDFYTVSPKTQQMIQLSRRLAVSDSTILIQGESGTGKELLAQAIHNASSRSKGPFVPVNFAALPMSLLESELFGYEEGSFTGAKKGGNKGLFEEAHGGTLFLDEIGDASMEFQVRLLRVLQEKQVRRVGGRKQIPIDVRIIAATNKNLFKEVHEGRFREDLYYRLNVLPLKTIPLRDRREDLMYLFNLFLNRMSSSDIIDIHEILDNNAIDMILNYNWPGNIRELINVTDYLVNIWESGAKLSADALPLQFETHFQNVGLVETLMDERTFLILTLISEYGPVGRNRLKYLASERGFDLSVGLIRRLLDELNQMGLVESKVGRQGTSVTEKGRIILNNKSSIK
jgi:sigma-54 dependent transcriptional regulator, acetoin dehydrogenase operon transcriptional activator AcoR